MNFKQAHLSDLPEFKSGTLKISMRLQDARSYYQLKVPPAVLMLEAEVLQHAKPTC